MLRTLRLLACVGFALIVAAGTTLGASTFEGTVKDPKGRPLRGAEVRVIKNGKIVSKIRTDANGHYVSAPVTPGIYQIDLLVNSVPVARFANTKAGATGSKEMNFDLKNAPRRIWVVETGSNIGRWVDLDDPSSQVPMQQLYKTDANYLQRLQDRTAGAMH